MMNVRYQFGPFELRPHQRVLLRAGEIVVLAPKALATLTTLVQRQDTVVLRDEIIDAVWPGSFVEEGSLSQNISILRKLMANDFPERSPIETIARVGYRFREPACRRAPAIPILRHSRSPPSNPHSNPRRSSD